MMGHADAGVRGPSDKEVVAHLQRLASARAHLGDLARQVSNLAAADLEVASLFWSPHPAEAERLAAWIADPVVRAHLG